MRLTAILTWFHCRGRHLTLGSPISFILREGVFSRGAVMAGLKSSWGILALTCAAAFAAPAAAEGITVEMNQAKIVKLARAADTIVVGNPAIADAAVQDATTIVLTGSTTRAHRSSTSRSSSRVAPPPRCVSTDVRMCRRFHAPLIARAPTRARPKRSPKWR